MLYSVIGWLYEVFLEVFIYKWGFSNRGVLFGPYCVIYGFGALLFLFLLSNLKKKTITVFNFNLVPVIIFLNIIMITTIVELIGSYIMEFLTGSWMWDYSNYFLNFEGRIALNPSIRFGIGGIIIIYVLQPFFEKIMTKIPNHLINVISLKLILLLILDCIYTFFLK